MFLCYIRVVKSVRVDTDSVRACVCVHLHARTRNNVVMLIWSHLIHNDFDNLKLAILLALRFPNFDDCGSTIINLLITKFRDIIILCVLHIVICLMFSVMMLFINFFAYFVYYLPTQNFSVLHAEHARK